MKNTTRSLFVSVLILIVFTGCNSKKETKTEEVLKEEILKTELEFEMAAREKGIAAAFYEFADERAVIKRTNDTLIIGRENIRKYYEDTVYKNALVNWTASFVDVSEDGTLGYTYGNFAWKNTAGNGKTTAFKGVFHTIWKRQEDGSWKYVWD